MFIEAQSTHSQTEEENEKGNYKKQRDTKQEADMQETITHFIRGNYKKKGNGPRNRCPNLLNHFTNENKTF